MLSEFYFILLMIHTFALSPHGEKSMDSFHNILVSANHSNTVVNKINATTNPTLENHINSIKKDLTHYSRENLNFNEQRVPNTTSTFYSPNEVEMSMNASKQTIDLQSQYDSSGEQNNGKSIVPKKGVTYNFSDIVPLNNNQIYSTTEAVISDLNLEQKTDKLEPNILTSENNTEKLNLTPLQEHVTVDEMQIGNRSNIVLPVIAVILSIPLIGILIIVFYKRGAEWWQHRHYRRMDFLIDGMYNN